MAGAGSGQRPLIGRANVHAELVQLLHALAAGQGGVVLLAGEGGIGKSTLAARVLEDSGLEVLSVTAGLTRAVPFGPLVNALRQFQRQTPDGLPHDDRFSRYLPVLLPELGVAPAELDRGTLFEVVRSAFAAVAQHRPTVVFLDDLHEADHATLDLLPYLATALRALPLALFGAYRTDELRRDHPLRRLRTDLRRAGLLREVVLEPFDQPETIALATHLLGGRPAHGLAALLCERTDGLPLFVEELIAALIAAGRLREAGGSWHLADPGSVLPVPETVRDLALLRGTRLTDDGRAAIEVAAVAGTRFDVDLVATVAGGEDILGEAFTHGLLVELDGGAAAFRHALIRDAFYGDIAWPRRRALHRQLAEEMERRGAAPSLLAEHWLAGRDTERARRALLRAMEAAYYVHAYRDAALAAQRALELWPEGDLEADRLAAIDRLGECAQLSGDLSTAAAAWREVAEAYGQAGTTGQHASTLRRLAGVYELQGAWEPALAAREVAARGFATIGQLGEAAAERLAAAAHLRSAATYAASLELLDIARNDAQRAGRLDLQARILGLEGNVLARQGQYEDGVAMVRSGLALALEHNHTAAAAEVYQRLGDALEHSGEYHSARQTYLDAAQFCQAQGVAATAQLCRACLTAVLRQTGDWDTCVEVCGTVLGAPESTVHAHTVAHTMLGLVRAHRGDWSRARSHLQESAALAARIELVAAELLTIWGMALAEDLAGNRERALNRCRDMLARWQRTEDTHYMIPALCWAVGFCAAAQEPTDARACANALARIVAETGTAEAIAALGYALGELSLLDDDAPRAAQHFQDALQRYEQLDLPYEHAVTRLRAGVALFAAGQREEGVRLLAEAYRTAQALGARPLAEVAARELADRGEPVQRRLGRRAAGLLERGGLTRRELEVLRLVAQGHTDREIAHTLVVSPRTVEMHVANCLGKLTSRSRAEAVRRAAELQLLDGLDG